MSSSGSPSHGKAAIHSSPSSAAHGLWSRTASMRRCSSAACTTSTGPDEAMAAQPVPAPADLEAVAVDPLEAVHLEGDAIRNDLRSRHASPGHSGPWIPDRPAPIHPADAEGAQRIAPPGTLDRGLCLAVVAAARCSPRPRRGAPAWRGSSPGAAGAAAATACRGGRCSSCSSCWRRRGGAVWFVLDRHHQQDMRRERGGELRRRRGCGATRPGCGSCSTSAAAQPIRAPGSHASYVRPRAQATVQERAHRPRQPSGAAGASPCRSPCPPASSGRCAARSCCRCTTRTARRGSRGRRTCACRACAPASRCAASC